jgi:hypothetical protein
VKLDKRHLVGSLMLLIGSIVYNVWVFTRPVDGTVAAAGVQAPSGVAPFAEEGSVSAAPVADLTQLPALPDVTLDRSPEWPRDPFMDMRRQPEPVVVEVQDSTPVAEPDPVVASILYSPSRRLAMIDGRVVRAGDVVSGVRVVEILRNAVIVESALGGRRTLSMTQPKAGPSR